MTYPNLTDSEVASIVSFIPADVKKLMRRKFLVQKNKGAKGERFPMELTFEQWAAIWWTSGNWHLRGCSNEKPYQMCRKDDLGNYSMGNVRIDTKNGNWVDSKQKTIQSVVTANSKPIIGSDRNTMVEVRYSSAREASRMLSINPSHISACVKGIRKTAGGYFWRYA